MANYPWIGGVANYIENAFRQIGADVEHVFYEEELPFYFRTLKFSQIKYLDRKMREKQRDIFNRKILKLAERKPPDVFFAFNEGNVNAETVEKLKNKHRVKTICLIGDDPFDSYRFRDLPYSLKYFDHIYVAEKMWIDKIRMVAPHSKIFKMLSAYDPDNFNINRFNELKIEGFHDLECQISFCGESYNQRAEGGYRSTVLSHLTKYDFKLWGDSGWKYQFKFYPDLKNVYMGGRLNMNELVHVYHNSIININMPSPQIITGFQPRVFEIAACGGFQIVDHREDLLEVFKENDIVTFKTIPELIEKVDRFIKYPESRKHYIEAGLNAVQGNTWKDRAEEILSNLIK